MKIHNQCMLHVYQNGDGKELVYGRKSRLKSYIKQVLAPQMGQGIMPNTVSESRAISFLKLSENPG